MHTVIQLRRIEPPVTDRGLFFCCFLTALSRSLDSLSRAPISAYDYLPRVDARKPKARSVTSSSGR